MPLGGYCRECGAWVWLTPDGRCQYGHPASSVDHVQELAPCEYGDSPSSQRALESLKASGAPATPRAAWPPPNGAVGSAAERSAGLTGLPVPLPADRRYGARSGPTVVLHRLTRRHWWWRHSLWLVWTFSLGFLSWVAFFFIGVKARRAEWIVAGFLYLLPPVLTLGFLGSPLERIFVPVQLVVAAVSVLHALLVRPEYRALMFAAEQETALARPPAPPELPRAEVPELPKGTDAVVAQVLSEAQAKVEEIRRTTESRIAKPEVRVKVGELCLTAEQILAELRAAPTRVGAARSFLTYYLDAAQRIVVGYADLTQRQVGSPEVVSTLRRAEESLDSIQEAFTRQLSALVRHEVIDLDSEIALLEKTVKMENLLHESGLRQE